MKARIYFGLVNCEALFKPCEAVAKMLQHIKASAVLSLDCVIYSYVCLCKRTSDKSESMCSIVQFPNSIKDQQSSSSFERYTDSAGRHTMHRTSTLAMLICSGSGPCNIRAAAQRQKTAKLWNAINGLYSGLDDIAAHLPSQVDRFCLHMQLTFLNDLTKRKES